MLDMPRIRIVGELRVRRRIGWGPLSWYRWRTSNFDQVFGLEEEARPAHRFDLMAIRSPGGILIRGSLRGVRCDFGEIVHGANVTSLAAPSVAGAVLNGRAELIGS